MLNANVKPSKKILDICSKLDYRFGIKKINGEFSIYKNLGNGYDIIVSGLDNNSKKINAKIAVRILYPEIKIVETFTDINSFEQINLLLIVTTEKYINKGDPDEYMYYNFHNN